tara:strand:+ start:1387 stop:1758 length:372 start_codon:yes stop_codon:yes gene_type:complete
MKKLPANFYIFFFMSFGWFFLIFYSLFHYTPDSSLYVFKYFDKIIHFVLFFIQTLLILLTLLLYGSNLNLKFILSITLFITLFALLSEIYQSILPLRKFDFFDFLSDFFGIVIALFYIKYFYK